MSALTIGIDLGTTFSTLAVYDPASQKPQIIPNADGERLTPSAVYLTEHGELQVGTLAVSQAKRTPNRVKRWVKREMGKDTRIRLGSSSFRPEELSAAILHKLVRDAERYFGTTIKKAVITVPAYFDEPRRKATVDAATIAGLQDVKILNEPTSAGLSFGLDAAPGKVFLVYDLGGGTFDVSVMRTGTTEMEVLAVTGDHRLGGFDFDIALAHHLAGRFEEEHGVYPSPEYPEISADWQELLFEAEEVKKKLSRLDEAQATVRFRGQRSDVVVTRAEFEELISPYISKTASLVEQAISEAEIDPAEIEHLVLVGGSTRMPIVQDVVKRILPHLAPMPGINPDEVVAMGAAIRAQLMTGESAGTLESVREVTAHPYGVILKDSETGSVFNEVLIPRNTRLPFEITETFYTITEGQESVEALVTQGESAEIEAVDVVGATELLLPSERPAGRPIEVAYRYDEEGRMHCEFVDRDTGNKAVMDYGKSVEGPMTETEVATAAENLKEYEIS